MQALGKRNMTLNLLVGVVFVHIGGGGKTPRMRSGNRVRSFYVTRSKWRTQDERARNIEP
jgi:hypothetical protein